MNSTGVDNFSVSTRISCTTLINLAHRMVIKEGITMTLKNKTFFAFYVKRTPAYHALQSTENLYYRSDCCNQNMVIRHYLPITFGTFNVKWNHQCILAKTIYSTKKNVYKLGYWNKCQIFCLLHILPKAIPSEIQIRKYH